jgi:hypothetical protein
MKVEGDGSLGDHHRLGLAIVRKWRNIFINRRMMVLVCIVNVILRFVTRKDVITVGP